MKIAIAGPIATENIKTFLNKGYDQLPIGYSGAPLLSTLIGELLARGHEVSAYTTSSDLPLNLAQPLMAEGKRFKIYYCPARIHSIRMNGRYLGRIVDFFRLERRYLQQAIHIDNPDVIHAHWAYEFALAAISSGKPHVLTCHDAPQKILKYMPNIYRLGRYFMARKAMNTAQKLTTVSPYMQATLSHVVDKNIEVIPNPIPPHVIRKIDLSRKLSESPVIAMVANGWDKCKNPQVAIQAFAKLRAELNNVTLRLFGSGFGRGESAQQWALKQGLTDGVEFVGRLPYENLLEAIAKADVFLHPSLEESFGMVIAEALALGLPVVGGNKSGAVPWVVNEAGILVDITSSDQIADALYLILKDPKKWKRLRTLGFQSARTRFSPAVVVTSYEKIYNELSQGKS
jgi:glycosyltransferase involved in cell wall biosynthesis